MPAGRISRLAGSLLGSRAAATCIPLISAVEPGFGTADAYAVADEIRRRRIAAGEWPRGYKIGFTNRGIWDRYGVHAPIWAPVWDTTLEYARGGAARVSLAQFVQPRLEPEVAFGFARAPRAGMSEAELARCIEWVAHSFEIVHTHFDQWRFQLADTVADFALHGRLFIGERVPIERFASPAAELAALQVSLCRGDVEVDQGVASIVLDGPLTALRLWVDAMAAQPQRWPIVAGDVVTTGTITDAAPMLPGERWHTRLSDPRLAGLVLHTEA